VGAVVVREGRVLLIRRGKEPLRGRWLVPGGTVEYGESLEQAIVREVEEETGVSVRPREVVAVLDRIHREGERVSDHFVIVDYLCDWLEGTPRAGSDAEAVALVSVQELPDYDLPEAALDVVREGLRRCGVALPSGPDGATISSNTLRLKA
jgi:mutator protein MutT